MSTALRARSSRPCTPSATPLCPKRRSASSRCTWRDRSSATASGPRSGSPWVAPAGMAPAWILVSRLSAEFPNIEITRVVSKTVFEKDVDLTATDLVVSTIPLDELGNVQTAVVSPLLRERDLRHLSRILGDPAH